MIMILFWGKGKEKVKCKFEDLPFPESLSLSPDKTLKKFWKFEQTPNISRRRIRRDISQRCGTWGFHKSGLTMPTNDNLVFYHHVVCVLNMCNMKGYLINLNTRLIFPTQWLSFQSQTNTFQVLWAEDK